MNRAYWTERVTLMFAALAAFGSIGAVFVAYGQWSWVFAAERAYLLGSFAGYGGKFPIPGIETSFSFTNYGKTPAELRDLSAECIYSARGVPDISKKAPVPGFTDQSGLMPPGYVVASEKSILPVPATLTATQAQIDQAKAGNGKIYCLAFAGYDDVRSNPHQTGVCWWYNFGIGRFLMCPEKGANYRD